MSERCKDIVIKGYSGSRGAAFLASSNMDKLKARFRPDYLERELDALETDIKTREEIQTAEHADKESASEHPEGILRGLYDLAVQMRCGMRIELKKIPVRQFTVEICELCGANPYRIPSDSVIELCGSGDGSAGERRVQELSERNIIAACIGCTTDGLDKVITDKTNTEYINKE